MRILKTAIASLALLGTALASAAQAGTVYDFNIDDPRGSSRAGNIDSFSTAYDTDNFLSLAVDISRNTRTGLLADGGWFVLSPGANPKGFADELAIFYMDFAAGDIYSYAYNGVNGATSYQNAAAHIQTFRKVLNVSHSADAVSVSFNNLDISAIQSFYSNAGWTGASFANSIGIWSHFTVLDQFATHGDLITMYNPGWQSWYDTSNQHTTTVSEPAGLFLLGLLMVFGFTTLRRRRFSKVAVPVSA